MAHSKSERSMKLETPLNNDLTEILTNSASKNGPTTKYLLKSTVLNRGEFLKQEIIGEKNEDKPHKVILMVGETGTGKSTLINAMINYIMGVRWEHKIWLEVAEIPEDQTESQTKAVTVYEVHAQQSPFVLTVIDTPGFGDTEGFDKDKCVAEALQQLFRSEDGIHEIHAVCLVLNATDARLHERKRYILDEILSLFGKDIEKHIVLFFTHHTQKKLPQRILNFVKSSLTKYIKNDENFTFKFDNCQSECFDEEDRESFKESWNNGIETFRMFFDYLSGINPKSLYMTEGVLRNRKQLDASVHNLKDQIKYAELRQQVLEQTKTELKDIKKNGLIEVDEPYKDKVPINASWWHMSKQATRCKICEENCHYPGCWWVSDLSNCSVMTEGACTDCKTKCDSAKHAIDSGKTCTDCKTKCDSSEHVKDSGETCTDCKSNCVSDKHVKDSGKTCTDCKTKCDSAQHVKNSEKICTVCTRKCNTSDHVKDSNIYVSKTRKVLKMKDELWKKYKDELGLEKEIKQIEAEKNGLVEECYQCLERLMEDALRSTSISSFIHLDFMIKKVKETGKQERVQKLEELKMRATEENRGLVERLNGLSFI